MYLAQNYSYTTTIHCKCFVCSFYRHKDLFDTKLKKCAYFRLISCHFFDKNMITFHKTEVQYIVLRCLMGLNYDWFNSNMIQNANISINTYFCVFAFCVIIFDPIKI